jgi:hypothetical protein
MAAAIGLVASPGVEAATFTENFDTSPANWTATAATSGGNNFGWSNTGNATGNAGEAGGTVARSHAYSTYLTSLPAGLDRTSSTLTMLGSIYLINNSPSFDGSFYLGFFDTAGLVSGAEPVDFVGIRLIEPGGGVAPNWRTTAGVFGGGGAETGLIPTGGLVDSTQYTFDLTYTGTNDGSGTLTGTLGGSSIGTLNIGAGSASFNAFGLANGGMLNAGETQTGQFFFDSVTYTIPEPSAALLGGLGMLALLRRRR